MARATGSSFRVCRKEAVYRFYSMRLGSAAGAPFGATFAVVPYPKVAEGTLLALTAQPIVLGACRCKSWLPVEGGLGRQN